MNNSEAIRRLEAMIHDLVDHDYNKIAAVIDLRAHLLDDITEREVYFIMLARALLITYMRMTGTVLEEEHYSSEQIDAYLRTQIQRALEAYKRDKRELNEQ